MREFREAAFVVVALSLLVVSGCTSGDSRATPPAQDQTAALPASGEAAQPPGGLAIKVATTSSGSDTAAFAFDHDLLKPWNSEMFAPGWIQLDLGEPTAITRVRLLTAQSPEGPTTHQIAGGLTPDNLAPLGTLDGNTADSQWLELQTKAEVRYLRVLTVKSPSWVAWSEIEVYD